MGYILFDLDDTLYTNDTGLFKELGTRLVDWVAQQLHVSLEESAALRQKSFVTYGTMMRGSAAWMIGGCFSLCIDRASSTSRSKAACIASGNRLSAWGRSLA